jgi:MoaA/NifB/PqqE/SkfB family radical SAM enzyme
MAPYNEQGVTSVEFKITYRCNLNCIFCDFGDRSRQASLDVAAVAANLAHLQRQYRIAEAVVSGGEPTIAPDFLKILHYLRSQGLSTYLHTNAVKLADHRFAELCLPLVDRVMVGYHAHTPTLHKILCRSGSLRDVEEGIRNIVASGKPTRANMVLTPQIASHTAEMIAAVDALGVRRAVVTFPFAIGRSHANFAGTVPSDFGTVSAAVESAMNEASRRGIALSIQGLPWCLLGQYAQFVDPWQDRLFVDPEHQLDQALWLFEDVIGRVYPPPCALCQNSAVCHGVSRDLIARGWVAFLRPEKV